MKSKPIYTLIIIVLFGCSHTPNKVSSHQQSQIQEQGQAATHKHSKVINVDSLPWISQVLVPPPHLPKHDQVAQRGPAVVKVQLFAEEKEVKIADGVFVQAMTFNGTIPGPIIVVHQNDYVELTLTNSKYNLLRHTIDLHAATGALGGAELMKVDPGQQKTIRFKATKAGVFVYHCAPGGPNIPYHVVAGMNGVIMVLPREGLKDAHNKSIKYDRAYYIGEQDFYVPKSEDGSYKAFRSPLAAMSESLDVMRTLTPSHVVFNGAVGALTGGNALTAAVGEKVLFIHSQANRDSRPHLIGGHADLVWLGGSFTSPPVSDYQTWAVTGGSAVAALYEFKQPGTYVYLSHNLIEAVLLGSAAHVKVSGDWNNDLMMQVK